MSEQDRVDTPKDDEVEGHNVRTAHEEPDSDTSDEVEGHNVRTAHEEPDSDDVEGHSFRV
jgi:hypothetical protein